MLYIILWLVLASVITFVLVVWLFSHVILQATLGYGVPYVPTPDYKVKSLLKWIELWNDSNFLDIWCWDGKVVEAIKMQFPEVQATGIENSLYPYYLARRRRNASTAEYKILRWNFFKKDISDYNVIYCYLLPIHMKRVWKKISQECKPWTLLYSSAFEIPNRQPKQKLKMENGSYIYVYEVE